jgi:MYXO-CTERM domain-containing protein
MRLRLAACASLLAWSASAEAGVLDAGADDAGAMGCGTVTPEGMCSGTTLTYCDTDTSSVVVVDCTMELESPTATCIDVSATWGSDCALAVGDDCLAEDENGDLVPLFCQGTGPGCVEGPTTASCLENVGPCDETHIGTCVAGRLILDCVESQPYALACEAFGATCSGDRCVGGDEGFPCFEGLECEMGLVCQDDVCTRVESDGGVIGATDTGQTGGADRMLGLFDTGTSARRDGGTGEEEDESGCSCAVQRSDRSGGALMWLFALLGVFAVRRLSAKRDVR